MIRGPQQDAAQTDAIASDRKRDDLASPTGANPYSYNPTCLKDERLVPGLTLVEELLPTLQCERRRLNICKVPQFVG